MASSSLRRGVSINAKQFQRLNHIRLFSTIVGYKNKLPQISVECFVGENCSIIGDVFIEQDASIWYNCVLRGDVASIHIGRRTNIQDGTVIHCNSAKPELDIPQLHTVIGDDVTVGHQCVLHACTLEERAFVGMQSCIMDGAVVESGILHCIVHIVGIYPLWKTVPLITLECSLCNRCNGRSRKV